MKHYLLAGIMMLFPVFAMALEKEPSPVAVKFAEALEKEMRETLRGVGREFRQSADEVATVVRNISTIRGLEELHFIDHSLIPTLTDDEIVEYVGRFSEHWSACWKHLLSIDERSVTKLEDFWTLLPSSCHYIVQTMVVSKEWTISDTKAKFDATLENLRIHGPAEIAPLIASRYWMNPIYQQNHERPKMNSIETRSKLHWTTKFDHIPAFAGVEVYHYSGIPHLTLYIAVIDGSAKLIYANISIFE